MSGFVGVGEVRPEPHHLQIPVGLCLERGIDQIRPVGRGGPGPAEPGVDLEVDPGRAAGGNRGRGYLPDSPRAVH